MGIYNHYIYKITNTINGKCYIGKTINPKTRWKGHIDPKNKSYISNAIRKHGRENFTFKIIESIQFYWKPSKLDIKKYVDQRESYLITKFNSYGLGGYNLTFGGEGGAMSDEHYKKVSMVQTKRIKNGTHLFTQKGFHDKYAKSNAKTSISNGTHPFQSSEIQSNTQKRRIKNGTHHLLGGKIQSKTQKRMVEKGTHVFQSGDIQRKQSADGLARPQVSHIKDLLKYLKIPQPPFIHKRSNEWIDNKFDELLNTIIMHRVVPV